MPVNVTLNGQSYTLPVQGDPTGWGLLLTPFLVAIPAGVLQKSGGLFTLSAETDFGVSFGLKSLYYKAGDGSPSSPSFTFSNDSDTGLHRATTNDISFVTGGTIQWRISSDGSFFDPSAVNKILTGSGSVSSPTYSFYNDSNTGFYNDSPDRISTTLGGIKTLQFDNGGISNIDGSAGIPSYTFLNDSDTGIFRGASNRLDISLGGTDFYVFGTTGFLSSVQSPASILVQSSYNGGILGISVDNQSNTASSDARSNLRVAGTSAGDPYQVFQIVSGSSWSIGTRNSDSDSLHIVNDTALGGSPLLKFTTNGDIYTDDYTDYSSTSTVVGWSSFSLKKIFYKKIGKLVWVWFTLQGTSNSTSVTFTLPYTSANTVETHTFGYNSDNGGASTTGLIYLNKNSATVNVYANASAGAWTNSGTKQANGILFYQAA